MLEPKPDIETLMDTNMEAKSKDSGAELTSSNKTKLSSTPSETSSKTKAATQGKQGNSATRDQGENHSSSKTVTRSSSRPQVTKKARNGNQDLAE